jgi:hypothetical protein
MTCPRTAAHEETELLSVLKIPFRELTPFRLIDSFLEHSIYLGGLFKADPLSVSCFLSNRIFNLPNGHTLYVQHANHRDLPRLLEV